MKRVLAIDIGASSGRHIVGWMDKGDIVTREVFRFKNELLSTGDNLVWNIEELEKNVRRGIDEALKIYSDISSLSIDTWGVDYVLIKDCEPVLPCISYRDKSTEGVIDKVHHLIDFENLYKRTGIQFQPFNTIYQLYRDLLSGKLEGVSDFLMIPEYLLYKLCGTRIKEYTNSTTTGLVNCDTMQFDRSIYSALKLPEILFKHIEQPGKIIGKYKNIDCILCATHDTASAVNGMHLKDDMCFISSGTWSLLGVKTDKPITDRKSLDGNWSNEGGIGYIRYQKNIMGMWLINNLRSELCPEESFENITKKAENSCFNSTVDTEDSRFLSPASMKDAFDSALEIKPEDIWGYFRCAYLSLAKSYKRAIQELEYNTHRKYEEILIVGGGANNGFLNKLTEIETGKKVVALPIEATSIGNIKLQLSAEGVLK